MLIKHDHKASSGVIDSTASEGNLVRVKTAKFISLVGSPANQVGFKVLRSDQGETKMNSPLVRRARRSDPSPVLRLTFPEGTEESAVSEALTAYGLSGYKVEVAEGIYTATRQDLKSISKEKTIQIKLSDDGIMATVAQPDTGVEQPADKNHVSMVALEFSGDKFTSDTVKAWLIEKSVDGTLQEPENPSDGYVVRRSEVSENEETRKMLIEDGVTAIISRSDVSNVPDGFFAVVNEGAYGNWGWGQYDFSAMMADVAFSDQMDEAVYHLKQLLQNIILWSPLPLDVRKELTNRALGQFGDYVGTVMDSLPRQLLVSVVRSANPEKEKTTMTKKTGDAGNQTEATAPATEVATPEAALTRADVTEIVKTAVAEALKEKTETTQRSDKSEVAAEVVTPVAESEKPLTRADMKALVEEITKPLTDSVEALKGITVVRGSTGQEQSGKEVVKDAFRGAFPGLRTTSKG